MRRFYIFKKEFPAGTFLHEYSINGKKIRLNTLKFLYVKVLKHHAEYVIVRSGEAESSNLFLLHFYQKDHDSCPEQRAVNIRRHSYYGKKN